MATDSPRGPRLRIVCVNDVYTLENLPRLASLVTSCATVDPADVLLTTLAGDFVAPSMLSSLDAGRGMVDCLNAIPITHVILGNHEDDIAPLELHARIAEFAGTWLSTNVLGFDSKLVPSQILVVRSAGREVHVGLIGVVMHDPTVYRAAPFDGATVLPANETALAAARHLLALEGCDVVVPLTHQDLESDRRLAQAPIDPPFPIIIGGHEHQIFLESMESAANSQTLLIKAGSDAVHAIVVDLEWPANAPPAGAHDLPTARARVEELAHWPENPGLRARVDGHMRVVHALETATLMHLSPGEALSSVGTRSAQTTLGSLICSRLRDQLGAEGCVFNGGGIRGNHEYQTHFTYGDLKAEVPFDNDVVVATVPGSVLREAIASSRAMAPVESGAFLQVDDRMLVGPDNLLLEVDRGALVEARDYRIAIVRNLFFGMDHVAPLIRFAQEFPASIPPAGSGREVKVLLVDAFALALWEQLGAFEEIDANHDGVLQRNEIADAVARATSEPASSITVDLLVKAIDAALITKEATDAARGRAHPRPRGKP